MDTEMKKAIEGTIEKWQGLCDSQTDMIEAGNLCDLCRYSKTFTPSDNFCPGCPLAEVERCRSQSTWGKVDSAVYALYKRVRGPLLLKDHQALRPLFEKMLSIIKGLLPDDK